MHAKRLLVALSTCTAFAVLSPAVSVAAVDHPVNCDANGDSELQTALDAATDGDTVTLAQGTTCHSDTVGGYDMKDNTEITVQGGGSGATIDGGENDYVLDGSDVHASTIRNLTIQNGLADFDGAGLEFDGDSPVTVADNTFLNNKATDGGNGGGLFIDYTPGESSAQPVTLRGNTFGGNGVNDPNSGDDRGGGALIEANGGNFSDGEELNSSGNRFVKNSAGNSGGGMYVRTMTLNSTNDQFVGNHVDGNGNGQGGGLAIVNSLGAETRNLVASGNTVLSQPPPPRASAQALEPSGDGGGIYFGSFQLGSELRVLDSTVVSNQAANGSGIDGAGCDALTLHNGIVNGNTGGEEISGFDDPECFIQNGRAAAAAAGDPGTRDIQFTDACDGTSPFSGNGNICADPQLVDPANGNVHQKSSSPTLDAGSNDLVPSGLTGDFEGDARIAASRLGGPVVVDMGADEVVASQPAVPASSTGCLNAGGNVNGKNLGPARLGRDRPAQRQLFKGAQLRTRLGLDKYCADPSGWFRIGYPNARLNRPFGRSLRRSVSNRVVLILTSSPRFSVSGITPRKTTASSAAKVLKNEAHFRIGKNSWYVVRASGQRLLLVKAQGGLVREIGLGDGRVAATRTLLLRYLRAWEGGL
jgi:hypothetical protein